MSKITDGGQPTQPFTPPPHWPDAKTEKVIDQQVDALKAVARQIDAIHPRGEAASTLARQSLATLGLAMGQLRQAYHAEMGERLTIWRAAGYPL